MPPWMNRVCAPRHLRKRKGNAIPLKTQFLSLAPAAEVTRAKTRAAEPEAEEPTRW